MITVCDIYDDFKNIYNTWRSGHVPSKKFVSWLYNAIIEIQNDLVKQFEIDQKVTDDIRGFITSVNVRIDGSDSVIKYPKDYRYFASLRYFTRDGKPTLCSDMKLLTESGKCRNLKPDEKKECAPSYELVEKSIKKVDNQRWADAIQSGFIKGAKSTQYNSGFKVHPNDINIVILDYIAIPDRPVLNIKLDDRQNATCAAGSSTLHFGYEMMPKILALLKQQAGSFHRKTEKYQEGQLERKKNDT